MPRRRRPCRAFAAAVSTGPVPRRRRHRHIPILAAAGGRPAHASPPPPPLPGASRSRHAAATILSTDWLRAAAPVPLSKCCAPPRTVARISPREMACAEVGALEPRSCLAADDGGAGARGRQPSPQTMTRAESVDASNDNGIMARKLGAADGRGRGGSRGGGQDGGGGQCR